MRRAMCFIALAAAAAAGSSCGSAIRQSQSPVVLTVNSFQNAAGSGNTLMSSVPAGCSPSATTSSCVTDSAQVTLGAAMKNVSPSVVPTTNNQVMITGYHVQYVRADGRNTPGVDVPYGFDGGVTGTVAPGASLTLIFEIVRRTAKQEAPLVMLANGSTIIHTIANVTFYGADVAGNAISVTGSMSVDFGNFGG